jgi:predicted AAA+ superfamily ATPase
MLDLGVDRLEHYLQRGSFPFMAERGPRARDFSQLRLALQKTIYDDVARSCGFDRTSSDAVTRLISTLASSESISYEKIGTALNISRATTSKALEALEQAGVITKLRPCGEASRMRLKTPRYKLRATAMRAMLLEDVGRNLTSPEVLGPLLEDAVTELLVQMRTDREVNEICFDQEDGGADLVVATGKRRLAIEVGWGKKDRRQVSQTRAREGCDFSLIVSSQDLRLDESVVWLPATWFLLM